VLVLPGTGADGNAVEADLIARGMPVEMADRDTIVAMVTLADRPEDIDELAGALAESINARRATPRSVVVSGVWAVDPVTVLSPRDAFFAQRESVPVERAVGRVSAELIAPYPPGIPVLAPGEEVTPAVVEALRAARAAGSRIAYAADPTVNTVDVVVT
jgi:arginine decarboxylase